MILRLEHENCRRHNRGFLMLFALVMLTLLTAVITCAAEKSIDKYELNVTNEVSVKKLILFINKHRGKTVELKILVPYEDSHIKVSLKGTMYNDADYLMFWSYDCKSLTPPISCEGNSLSIKGSRHALNRIGNGYLLSGSFQISNKVELHQGIKCFSIMSY
jgi:hypothetical protein